jgi:nucleoside-diphosphate-sugar epimerase
VKRIAEEDLLHIYNHTSNLWDSVKNKKIFITGSTGFFGKWLLESFSYINNKLSLNAEVYALSRNPEAFVKGFPFYADISAIKFIQGDIMSFSFPDEKFQYIIHAATDADAKLNSENPLLMMDTITIGTRRMLDFARMQPLESFLLTSSGAVYGKQPANVEHVKESESYPVDINNPSSAYAEGKRIAELYCATYHQQFNLPVKIARCFAFVGPYLPLDKHFAIGNFILDGLNRQNIIIKGDGTPYRSYLYAADLTVWLWTILFKGTSNVPYNVGSDQSLSIKETAEAVAQNFTGTQVQVLGKPSGQPPLRYVPDVAKIASELNLQQKIDIQKAIQNTISFYS